MAAWQPYLHVRDEILVIIANHMARAPSVLLQVLYFLQEGHVQYLLRQYREAFVDQFGANAIPREKAAPAPRGTTARISAGPPRTPRDLGEEPSKVEDEADDDVDIDNDAAGSDFDYICDVEDDEAHTSVSSTRQKEARRLHLETATTSRNTETKRLASALTPRHAQSRATIKS